MDRKDLPTGDVVYRESRDLESPLITYRDGRVVEIMVDHHSRFDVTYRGLSVFATPARDLLRELERQDGRAFWGFGAVVFPALSVGTSNFVVAVADDGAKLWWEESPEKPPRSLTLAERGAYDPFLAAHYRQVTFA
ncbi:MAG: hypothetical protein MUE98_12595 [Rhodobacteraceae bacterium]|nr:hypothetical protein [Paracoccaceae bacterium]